MIEQQGRIVRVEDGRAWIAVGPRLGCSACEAGQGCGAGLFGRLLKRKPVTLSVANPECYPVGKAVVLGIPELSFLRLVLRLYGSPLLAGLAGALICHQVCVAYGLSRAVTDFFTLVGLIGFAWLGMPQWRSSRAVGAIEEQITLGAVSEETACAAAQSESLR